jgi:hypothetical protein
MIVGSGSQRLIAAKGRTIADHADRQRSKMNRAILPLTVAALMLAGCGGVPSTPVIAPPPLTELALKNAMYRSPDWGEFQLVNGAYFRPPMAPGESAEIYKTEFREPAVFGDLNADGAEDAIVFLSTQNGGTGHFIELAAVLNRDSRAENVSTVGLGDRVGVEAARIEAGVIALDMRVHGPNDPMCCASQLETWRFTLEGEELVRQP